MSQQPATSNRSTVHESQARTLKPITAYPINREGKARVIPGGALVTIHNNVTHGVITATAHMGGDWYEAMVQPDQFTPYDQSNQ